LVAPPLQEVSNHIKRFQKPYRPPIPRRIFINGRGSKGFALVGTVRVVTSYPEQDL
jgi:hypothetical protein